MLRFTRTGLPFVRYVSSNTDEAGSLVFGKLHANGVLALITFNRRTSKNAISKDFLQQFHTALDMVESAPSVRCMLLRSSLPDVFCAGADLKERKTMTLAETRDFVQKLRDTTLRISALPFPTIACINGVALGGGFEFALGCDFRVASKKAVVGLPETSLAIIPGAGGTAFLSNVAGEQAAKYMIFTGGRFNVEQAVQLGVADLAEGVNESLLAPAKCKVKLEVESAEGDHAVSMGLQLASCIIQKGPVAIRAAKRVLRDRTASEVRQALKAEEASYEGILHTSDRLEALAAFLDKRAPNFRGQ